MHKKSRNRINGFCFFLPFLQAEGSAANVGQRDGADVALFLAAILNPVFDLLAELFRCLAPDLSGDVENGLLGEGFFHALLRGHHGGVNRTGAFDGPLWRIAFKQGATPTDVAAFENVLAAIDEQSVDGNGVTLSDGQHIEAKTVVWTTGVRASSLTEQIPAERDKQGRLHVDAHLKVVGQDDIFATGDVAHAATDDIGNYALMTCQHAISLGRHAGNNVAAQILGVEPTPYSQPKYVTCLDLGAWGAVYTEGLDRQVKLVKQEGKTLKTQINTQWIYPPAADRVSALAAADPRIPVVA